MTTLYIAFRMTTLYITIRMTTLYITFRMMCKHWDNNAKHCPAELLDDDRDAVDEARYKLITIVCKKKRRKKNNTLPFQSVKIYLHSDISADYLCVYLSIFVVQ
jgi:hypothetical protein